MRQFYVVFGYFAILLPPLLANYPISSGWHVLDQSPAFFTRTQSVRPLPEPERGGHIGLLRQHINILASRRVMVLTLLLSCFRPDTPFPVLELIGGQSSAKSTTAIHSAQPDRSQQGDAACGRPTTVENVFVAAANNWLVSYENLS